MLTTKRALSNQVAPRPWSRRPEIGILSCVLAATVAFATERAAAQDPPAPEPAPAAAADAAADNPFKQRIPAPELDGGTAWINTAGPLRMKDLRGKFVLLDFWTYCCINCMHILPELKKLEHAYPNELVVIGVHSAKFETEQDSANITEAVLRYEIEHPVVNDANHVIWRKYLVNSWPSLRLIDPEGFVVAEHGGEIDFETLDAFLRRALPYYRKHKLLDATPLHFDMARDQAADTPLLFPGKVLADEAGGRLFIADSNHNRIVVATLAGKLVDVIGSGQIGAADGPYDKAQFDHPQGMALVGDTLYVADTENHLLRKIDLKSKTVTTIAGTGRQGRNAWPGIPDDAIERGGIAASKLPTRYIGKPEKTGLNSPWDLWAHGDDLYIAMAGTHQIWKMPLDEREIGPYAGNAREDIVDGALLPRQPYATQVAPGGADVASFAQPSGLASDGTSLFVADSEGSSIRAVPFKASGKVRTVVGTSHLPQGRLFAFGDVDGQGEAVRLQHALGVVFHDGRLYVADTYNNKIKVIDVKDASCTTLAGTGKAGRSDEPAQFDEPGGISFAAGKLYVADTNNHAIRVVDLAAGNRVETLAIEGLKPPVKPSTPAGPSPFADATTVDAAEASVKPVESTITIAIDLKLPDGYKINKLAPMAYRIDAGGAPGPLDPKSLGKLERVKEPAEKFTIRLQLAGRSGSTRLKVSLAYYYCQEGSEGVCKAGSVVWNMPVEIAETAAGTQVSLTYQVP
ncbi:MAG: redoxin domain-containing protein [Pirellulales bacterium]|nr:redoxin domain-containing protein [Pirellulales bacterium]